MRTYANENDLASDIATLLRSARAVISKNQTHINNAEIGDKGLIAAKVLAETRANFLKVTRREVDGSNPYLRAEMDAIAEVMNQAQALINQEGKGFKGFLPAVFAKSVADKTTKNLYGKAVLKLTAPKRYVRNRVNRPDKWERDALETYLASMTVEENSPYAEMADVKGTTAYRFILPEFYKESCLACHGQLKGELDITGGKKEGGVLGELGGACQSGNAWKPAKCPEPSGNPREIGAEIRRLQILAG